MFINAGEQQKKRSQHSVGPVPVSQNPGAETKAKQAQHSRICVSCRNKKPQIELIRLTVDCLTGAVKLNNGKPPVHGRSAYLCRLKSCVTQAVKGGRLKHALDGRKVKGVTNTRSVRWPLEPQLIHDIAGMCTDSEKTCQNTESKEVLE